MKRKKIFIGVMLVCLIGTIIFFKEKDLFNGYFSTVKLQFLLNYISDNYLYDVDEKLGEEGIYTGYLEALQSKGTYYLNKNQLKTAKIRAEGNEFGVGLKLMWGIDEQFLIVVEVANNSPASKAGMRVGDCIIKINDVQAISANGEKIIELINNEAGESIQYEIKRDQALLNIQLTPEEIVLEDFKEEVIEDILYIKFNTVKEGTSSKLDTVIKQVGPENCKGIILDLRDVTTDNIKEINKISDLFLDEGTAFKVQTKQEGVVLYTTKEGAYTMNMILLTNQQTKGGMEALVLALKERGQILGGNTGGDAYLSQIITFEDGTGMSVASGKISDRYGEVLSEKGIEPDVRLYISEQERIAIFEKGYISKEEDSYLREAIKRLKSL